MNQKTSNLILQQEKDPMGCAMLDYLQDQADTSLVASCNVAEDDIIPPEYLFRTYADTSELEKLGLDNARGKILDIGAGAGCHSLYLHRKGCDVTSIDISPGAVEAMKQQGLTQVHHADIFNWEEGPYDTLLMLMNGIGLVGTLDGFAKFLRQAKKLLAPGGQILFDSTDVLYVYQQPDGSVRLNLAGPYYGEVTYKVSYKEAKGDRFPWLYLDYWMLTQHAAKEGFGTELLMKQENEHYLARLFLPS